MIDSQIQRQSRSDRLLHGVLRRFYPRPDLVFFLDAPPETLYERKPEVSVSYLNRRRGAVLALGKEMANSVRIDASQPLDQVVADVAQQIAQFRTEKGT